MVPCRTLCLAFLVFLCYLSKSVPQSLNFIGVELKSFYRYFFLNTPILQSKQLVRYPCSNILHKGCFVDFFKVKDYFDPVVAALVEFNSV